MIESDEPSPVAVVLSGGGARGAYEVGVLSELLPTLKAWGQSPSIFLGTSAGALNAVLFAAYADAAPADAAAAIADIWRRTGRRQVFRPIVPSLALAGVRDLVGRLTGSAPLRSLLDTTPLLATLENQQEVWRGLQRNLGSGTVEAVAVAATLYPEGRTVVFADGRRAAGLRDDPARSIDYVHENITAAHLRASAAIPVFFPPVFLSPAMRRGWFVDGGVRLNVPIKPAIALGADRVLVVGTEPVRNPEVPVGGRPAQKPAIQDSAALMLKAVLNDPMVEDLLNLRMVNEILENAGRPPEGIRVGDKRYRTVRFRFVGPTVQRSLGVAAGDVLANRLAGLRPLLDPELALLRALLGPRPSSDDLLSYLLFEPDFVDAAIQLGSDDAKNLLKAVLSAPAPADMFWMTTSLP